MLHCALACRVSRSDGQKGLGNILAGTLANQGTQMLDSESQRPMMPQDWTADKFARVAKGKYLYTN